MSHRPRNPDRGRSKTQHLCLLAASKGHLVELAHGDLALRDARMTFRIVRTFGKVTVRLCEKRGWLTRIPRPDGSERIMTTLAGDAELAKPLRLARPTRNGGLAPWRAEALR